MVRAAAAQEANQAPAQVVLKTPVAVVVETLEVPAQVVQVL